MQLLLKLDVDAQTKFLLKALSINFGIIDVVLTFSLENNHDWTLRNFKYTIYIIANNFGFSFVNLTNLVAY